MTSHQPMKPLEDWVAETPESIAARLEGAKASQAQIRFTLGMMAIISTMMLIASYNAYLSYDYEWILAAKDRELTVQTAPDILTTQALKDWAASRIVLISLLGIRVSVDDAAVLGSAVLFILSLWLVLWARRENHTIGFLLRDTDTPRVDGKRAPPVTWSTESQPKKYAGGERWLIFHTILSSSLFVAFEPSLSRVQSLNGPNPMRVGSVGGFKGWLNRAGFGFVRSFFFLFPVIASFAVFCVDRLSYFMPDPFAPNAEVPGIAGNFFWRSMTVFFLCWIPLVICCWKSSQYSRATAKVLREYGSKLRSDLFAQDHPVPQRSVAAGSQN